MLRFLSVLALVIAQKAPSAGLVVGSNLPGTFHPYNVTGAHKGNFHCLISEHGLNPAVLIFCRDLELTPPAKDLLQKLDLAVEKNPKARLAVSVVFVPDELKDVVTDDDKRQALATGIEDATKEAMLKNVVLALASKADVAKYGLDDNAAFTIVVYNKLQVRAVEKLDKDQLTAEKVQAIQALMGEKLGATKK
jgi:hypothetical protein